MSVFGNALDAIQQAKQQAGNGGGNGRMEFLKIKDGETKTLRFLTGFTEQVVYNCSDPNCTCKGAEMPKVQYEEMKAAGQSPVCPVCGKPFGDEHIVGTRPSIIPAQLHMGEKVIHNGNQTWRSFLCLSESPLQKHPDGSPKYPCPICAQVTQDGKHKRPSLRLTAVAVVREKVTEQQTTPTGQVIQKVVDVRDEMVEDDEGNQVPHIVVVQMGANNFFAPLMAMDQGGHQIQFFDFDVTRTGASLDTKYMFNPLTQADNPIPVPFDRYASLMPDIEKYLNYTGSPEYYAQFNYDVQGYVPEQRNQQPQQQYAQQQAQPQMQNGQSQVQTPQIQNPMQPSGDANYVSFDQVASQFGGYGA